MRSVFHSPVSRGARPGALYLLLLVAGCGPDETLFLFGGAGGTSGQGGDGGAGLPTCLLHSDCTGALAWCDRAADACVACPLGLEQCGGECVDTTRDPRHCGGCFAPCGASETCAEAICHCSPGTLECGEECVDTHAEPLSCGGCDHPCDGGLVCDLGECHGSCQPGFTQCSIDGGVGCIDLMVGPRCGDCDIECGPHEACVAGSCRATVPATPCAACPCDDVCHAALGDVSACCDGVHGDPHPTCVAGDACP